MSELSQLTLQKRRQRGHAGSYVECHLQHRAVQQIAPLFDQRVGAQQEPFWYREANFLRSLEIDG